MRRLVVLSPHCDDAVFACGDLLARHPGAVVITVFAGPPPAGSSLTQWDAAAGFGPDDDVMAARREEDRRALAMLGAHPLWLDFCDCQYGSAISAGLLAGALGKVIAPLEPAAVVVPLGLFHSDHKLVHEATIMLLRRRPSLRVFAYEDAIYRTFTGLLEERLERLLRSGLRPRRVALLGGQATARKRWAVHCYRSQLQALSVPGRPGFDDAFAEEAIWQLAT